jgi:Fe-S cluster biogenesis protein NfuA
MDGSEIEVLDVTNGIARLLLHGTCASCPSTVMILVMGMEQELRKWVPEVEFIELSS